MLILMRRSFDTLKINKRYYLPNEQAEALIQLGYAEALPEQAARQPVSRTATRKRGIRR